MERRFKTSNHSNEQAKRISIEASGIDKKKEVKKDEKKIGCAGRKRGLERRGTRARFLSRSTRDSEDADDYNSSREIPLRKFQLFDENVPRVLVDIN